MICVWRYGDRWIGGKLPNDLIYMYIHIHIHISIYLCKYVAVISSLYLYIFLFFNVTHIIFIHYIRCFLHTSGMATLSRRWHMTVVCSLFGRVSSLFWNFLTRTMCSSFFVAITCLDGMSLHILTFEFREGQRRMCFQVNKGVCNVQKIHPDRLSQLFVLIWRKLFGNSEVCFPVSICILYIYIHL